MHTWLKKWRHYNFENSPLLLFKSALITWSGRGLTDCAFQNTLSDCNYKTTIETFPFILQHTRE